MKPFILAILLAALSSFGYSDKELVATCLIREAGAPGECMASVMHVIANRSKIDSYAGFKAVITRKHQFESIYGQDRTAIVARAKKHKRFNEAMRLVSLATIGKIPATKGMKATHFFNPKVVLPKWSEKMVFVARIGGHDFYRE